MSLTTPDAGGDSSAPPLARSLSSQKSLRSLRTQKSTLEEVLEAGEHADPELYVDEAFRFSGPSTKIKESTNGALPEYIIVIWPVNVKECDGVLVPMAEVLEENAPMVGIEQKIGHLEEQTKAQALKISDLKLENVFTKENADAKVKEYKLLMEACRENEKKTNEEMARLQGRTRQLEELLQATSDAKNARETEVVMLQGQMETLMRDARDTVAVDYREREKLLGMENANQQDI
eukprot:g18046.t1